MDYSEDFNYGNDDNEDDTYGYDNGNVNFSTNVIILLLWQCLALLLIPSLGICLFGTFKTRYPKKKPQPPPLDVVQLSTRSTSSSHEVLIIITGDEERTVAESDCSEDENKDNDNDFEGIDTDNNDSGECDYNVDDVDVDVDVDLDVDLDLDLDLEVGGIYVLEECSNNIDSITNNNHSIEARATTSTEQSPGER
jgi:hypothetical protein